MEILDIKVSECDFGRSQTPKWETGKLAFKVKAKNALRYYSLACVQGYKCAFQ